jgi:hypothetical protein
MISRINQVKDSDLPRIAEMASKQLAAFGGLENWCKRVERLATKAEEVGQFKTAMDCLMAVPKLVSMMPDEREVDFSQVSEEEIRQALVEVVEQYTRTTGTAIGYSEEEGDDDDDGGDDDEYFPVDFDPGAE